MATGSDHIPRIGRAAADQGNVVDLSDMITQRQVREQFPWLTAQKLTKFRKAGLVRYFPSKGDFVYPKGDISAAVTAELQKEPGDDERDAACPERTPPSNTAGNGSTDIPAAPTGTGAGTTPDDDALVSRALELVSSNRPKRR